MDDESAGSDVHGVVITGELDRRPSRAPEYEAENKALTTLAEAMGSSPGTVLQRLAEAAMELTHADSAGISLLEPGGEQGTFRWIATAGAWAPYRNGTMPRQESPCGEVLAREDVLLMRHPERLFPALLQTEPGVGEGLLGPFHIDGRPAGTVWIIKHGAEGRFQAEDARLLRSLARFASAAYRMVLALDSVEAGRKAELERAAAALSQSQQAYRTLIETIDDGFTRVEVLFDAEGRPYDYRFIEVNAGFGRQTGLVGAAGRTARELVPNHPQHWFDIFGRIVRSGRAERFEEEQEALGKLYEVHAAPVGTPEQHQLAVLFHDVLPRRQAETALRESEARFRAFVVACSDAVYRMSADWAEMHQLEGQTFLPDTKEPSTSWQDRYIHPDDRAEVRAAILQAIETRSTFELEHRVIRADGSLGWTHSRAVPIFTDGGDISEWLGTASDITAARESAIAREVAESASRESEERLRQFGEASSDVLWIRDAEHLQWTYLTPAFDAIYGLRREEALTGNDFRRWAELIVPEDRDQALESIQRVRMGERVTFEYRIRRPIDGGIRRIQDTDFPICDAQGRIYAIGGVGHDITDERAMSDRQEVLVAELQHRTRNLLGVVRGIADKTAASAASLDDFLPRYRDRLGALARINGLLSKLEKGERVTFEAMIRTELEARGVLDGDQGEGERIVLEGPPGVSLRSATVQTFALAIHELTTNAVKYGALADGQGRLDIRWRVDRDDAGQDRLHVEWIESGVLDMPDTDAAPRGGGYGRMLIERALPYQLSATTTYDLGHDGVRCTIDLPLS